MVHEAPLSLGMGAEIIAKLSQKTFDYLKSPPLRVTGEDTHIPYFLREEDYLPNAKKISQAIQSSLDY